MDIKQKITSYENASAEIELSWFIRIDGCWSHGFEMPLMQAKELNFQKMMSYVMNSNWVHLRPHKFTVFPFVLLNFNWLNSS